MSKRTRYRYHIDPEYRRWGQKYPRFPGVAECTRLIREGYAHGTWVDIIPHELAENAASCLDDMIGEFQSDPNPNSDVRLFIMMALDIARLPASVPFLVEVLRQNNPRFIPYAMRALNGINTKDARTALWNAGQA